jgi:3-hydroxybutyryl-CoA dehydrogenase
MQVAILTDKTLRSELLSHGNSLHDDVVWVDTISQLQDHLHADAWVDLLFEKEHLTVLKNFPKTIIINSVVDTLNETDHSFVRINGWPTFLKSDVVEASAFVHENKLATERVFALFNKKVQWLPDQPGFLTARVISMIINEAFICLKEGISTENEIDLAMQLGTSYPHGPFEWAKKIGIEKINGLLDKLGHAPNLSVNY